MLSTPQRLVAAVAATALAMTGALAVVAPTSATAAGTELISQGAPATASSLETSAFPASAAVDGVTTTRWASLEGIDPQWITVDLGDGASVSRVVLKWEAAYASKYSVQLSSDGVTWTTLATETAGDGGTDEVTGLTGTGRYLRVHGTARGTAYGYSLWEMQVYGESGTSGDTATHVTSLAQLQTAINNADPGETIVLADGTYNVSGSDPISVAGGGSASSPVTIAAESVGGVTLTGSKSFVFDDAHDVVIQGFVFTQSTTLTVPADSRAITLSRNEFVLADIEGLHNVSIRADDTVIEYNYFHGKSTLGVYLGIGGAGSTEMAQNVHVHHNYFADHTFPGKNGGESIRLGVSPRALSSAHAIVEYNLFENANGDPEAISVKSSDNIVRYNTIRDSIGGIVLRHGNRNTVESNHIIDGDNGIRVYGNDHIIVNNYVGGISGKAVIIGSGTLRDHFEGESKESRKQNDAPDRILIALNTLVGNEDGIAGETNRTVPPLDVTIVDNVIQGSTGELADVPLMQDFYWRGNILWGAAANGNIPSVGYTRVNPQLTQDAAGVWRIGSSSPAIDAATQNHSAYVSDDIDGRDRSGTADVGAHEFTSNSASRAPLTTADVGPLAP